MNQNGNYMELPSDKFYGFYVLRWLRISGNPQKGRKVFLGCKKVMCPPSFPKFQLFYLFQGAFYFSLNRNRSNSSIGFCFLSVLTVPLVSALYFFIWGFWNGGTPKSSTCMGFSIISHPFGGYLIYGKPHIDIYLHICVYSEFIHIIYPVVMRELRS